MLAAAPTARLVVVDYAETRQEQLAEVLPVLAGQATQKQPVRVLLTIRSRAAGVEDVRGALYGRSDALDVVIDEAGVDLLSELPFGEVAGPASSRRQWRRSPAGWGVPLGRLERTHLRIGSVIAPPVSR